MIGISVMAMAAAAAAQRPTAADLAGIDQAIRGVYEVISGPPGQKRDFDRMRNLFAPGATLKAIGPKGLHGGSLDPDCIHLPGIYVQRMIVGAPYDKKIEFMTTREREAA